MHNCTLRFWASQVGYSSLLIKQSHKLWSRIHKRNSFAKIEFCVGYKKLNHALTSFNTLIRFPKRKFYKTINGQIFRHLMFCFLTARRMECIWLNPKIVLLCCLFAFQNWYPADCKQTSEILSSIIAYVDLTDVLDQGSSTFFAQSPLFRKCGMKSPAELFFH